MPGLKKRYQSPQNGLPGQLWTTGVFCAVHTKFYKFEPIFFNVGFLFIYFFICLWSSGFSDVVLSHPAAPLPHPTALEVWQVGLGEVLLADPLWEHRSFGSVVFPFTALQWGPSALAQGSSGLELGKSGRPHTTPRGAHRPPPPPPKPPPHHQAAAQTFQGSPFPTSAVSLGQLPPGRG